MLALRVFAVCILLVVAIESGSAIRPKPPPPSWTCIPKRSYVPLPHRNVCYRRNKAGRCYFEPYFKNKCRCVTAKVYKVVTKTKTIPTTITRKVSKLITKTFIGPRTRKVSFIRTFTKPVTVTRKVPIRKSLKVPHKVTEKFHYFKTKNVLVKTTKRVCTKIYKIVHKTRKKLVHGKWVVIKYTEKVHVPSCKIITKTSLKVVRIPVWRIVTKIAYKIIWVKSYKIVKKTILKKFSRVEYKTVTDSVKMTKKDTIFVTKSFPSTKEVTFKEKVPFVIKKCYVVKAHG